MKNIQIIDGADNCVYDIFAATDEEFALVFPDDTDIAFIDEVYAKGDERTLDLAFGNIWKRPIKKRDAQGIHGIIFYQLAEKMAYYPTRKDEEAMNPDGSRLRQGGATTLPAAGTRPTTANVSRSRPKPPRSSRSKK